MSPLISWRLETQKQWEVHVGRFRGARLHQYVDLVLPEAEDRILSAAGEPALQKILVGSYRWLHAPLLRSELKRFLQDHVTFGWNVRRTATSRVYATARTMTATVSWNPHAIRRWIVLRTPRQWEALILDLTLHELGHLLNRRFSGGRGHDWRWRAWGKILGYVPFGGTQERKRIQLAEAINSHRIREGVDMKHGVMKDKAGWKYVCGSCKNAETGISSRDGARDLYRAHRLEDCPGQAATPKPPTKRPATKARPAPDRPVVRKVRTYRVAEVISKKSGKPILIGPNAKGEFPPSEQARYGVKKVDEWVEVKAAGWADATTQVKAGKGKKVRRAG